MLSLRMYLFFCFAGSRCSWHVHLYSFHTLSKSLSIILYIYHKEISLDNIDETTGERKIQMCRTNAMGDKTSCRVFITIPVTYSFNPIDQVWNALGRCVHHRQVMLQTSQDLQLTSSCQVTRRIDVTNAL